MEPADVSLEIVPAKQHTHVERTRKKGVSSQHEYSGPSGKPNTMRTCMAAS